MTVFEAVERRKREIERLKKKELIARKVKKKACKKGVCVGCPCVYSCRLVGGNLMRIPTDELEKTLNWALGGR